MPVEHLEYAARRTFGSLDGLRALSIVAVIWHHSSHWRPIPLLERGFLGVDVFFVISGYLIVTLLLRERARTGGISLRKFYIRRSLRIFPVYYGVLAGLAGLALVRGAGNPESREYFALLPFYLAYLSNWLTVHAAALAPTWSLATEEQFYLVWPLVEKLIPGRRVVVVLIGAILASLAVSILGFHGFLGDRYLDAWSRLSILQVTFTPILMGVGLAHALHRPGGFRALSPWLGSRFAALASAVALVGLAAAGPPLMGPEQRALIQLAATALVGACVIREDNALAPFLRVRWIRRIGVVSYGMYLFHSFLHGAVRRVEEGSGLQTPVTGFVVMLLLAYAVAELSYWAFERHFLAIKDRFARDARTPGPGATAEGSAGTRPGGSGAA